MAEPEAQPQQSWAAWFLDAYANSVVTSHEDLTDDSAYDSMSPTSDDSAVETSSPYGPYVRTGRGGAGNFTWQSQQPPSSDVEAQKPISLRDKRKAAIKIDQIDTSAAIRHAQAKKTSTYVKLGRGGAGNLPIVQSNEPQPSPTATSFPKSPRAASSPVIFAGRGGAGNFGVARANSDLAKRAREELEQAEAEKRRIQAEQQVSSLLQAPSQAHVGTRRRSGIPTDFEHLA